MTVAPGAKVRVGFNPPVSAVVIRRAGRADTQDARRAGASVSLGASRDGHDRGRGRGTPVGEVGAPTRVSWFPPSTAPVMVEPARARHADIAGDQLV